MPPVSVRLFREESGKSSVLDWLRDLRTRDADAYAKCVARVRRLAALGHELRRPEADYLRDGVYELRVRRGRVNYRILYFFHGREVVVLAHGLTKEAEVPRADIERALVRKRAYEADPQGRSVEFPASRPL